MCVSVVAHGCFLSATLVNIRGDDDLLRQVRMVALVPNKKDHRDDSGSDDAGSHISRCGNSSSSQGGGQQSGSGQNSNASQNSASNQNSGQSSSRGVTSQGSSAGGDGNDEEDKDKMKQTKYSDRQNEVCAI